MTMPAIKTFDRAYTIVVVDPRTGAVARVFIASAPSSGLTQDLHNDLYLDGPSAMGHSYEEARRSLLQLLSVGAPYRYLLSRMSPRDRSL